MKINHISATQNEKVIIIAPEHRSNKDFNVMICIQEKELYLCENPSSVCILGEPLHIKWGKPFGLLGIPNRFIIKNFLGDEKFEYRFMRYNFLRDTCMATIKNDILASIEKAQEGYIIPFTIY